MSGPGFLAVYRWSIAAGHEDAFEAWWREGTEALKVYGSFGSSLIREADGRYLGVALWPDAETRTTGFAARAGRDPAPGAIDFEEVGSGAILAMLWSGLTD